MTRKRSSTSAVSKQSKFPESPPILNPRCSVPKPCTTWPGARPYKEAPSVSEQHLVLYFTQSTQPILKDKLSTRNSSKKEKGKVQTYSYLAAHRSPIGILRLRPLRGKRYYAEDSNYIEFQLYHTPFISGTTLCFRRAPGLAGEELYQGVDHETFLLWLDYLRINVVKAKKKNYIKTTTYFKRKYHARSQ